MEKYHFANALFLVVNNLVFHEPHFLGIMGFHLFPGWETGLLRCRFLRDTSVLPGVPGTHCRAHGNLLQLLRDDPASAFAAGSNFIPELPNPGASQRIRLYAGVLPGQPLEGRSPFGFQRL